MAKHEEEILITEASVTEKDNPEPEMDKGKEQVELGNKKERIPIKQRVSNYFTYDRKRLLYTITYFLFIAGVLAAFIYFKIKMAISPPPTEVIDYSQYDWYLIPYIYIINYIKNAWYSLILAFLLAGIIYEFVPNKVIKKWLGGGKFYHYLLAAALAPIFITCSCSVIPVYVGILASGASLGVAMTFFLMAPAANFITIMMTGEYIGWDLGLWRLGWSFIAAVICGIIFDQFKFTKKLKEEFDAKIASDNEAKQIKRLNLKKTIHDRTESAYTFSWKLVKTVLPRLLFGLIVVSFLIAYIPDRWIENYFQGIVGIVIAALLGGPLYTPTLVEIVMTQSLITLGMDRAVALSFMMGQPYDFVSMVPNSKYFKWRGVLIYTVVFFAFSIISALIFALAYKIPLV
ncbi:MAG: permease [Candidatus Heimdallarchaeota archaeon]|nr:permease [Candidatus Heimdallarchaeota archaeon]